MKTLLLLLLLLTGCSTERIIFSESVKKITTEMTLNSMEERTLCLKYYKIYKNIYVYDYKIPKTFITTTTSVGSNSCPESHGITWHMHPENAVKNLKVKEYYLIATGDKLEEHRQLVYLSATDIAYARKAKPKYMMVQTDVDLYAWWKMDQIELKYILLPIDKQKSWR